MKGGGDEAIKKWIEEQENKELDEMKEYLDGKEHG